MSEEQFSNGQREQGPENEAVEPKKMSRREALALVGKHAVYTAPAVLAVLSVTKSNSAHASGGLNSP